MYRLPRSLTLRHTPSPHLIRRPCVRIPRHQIQRRFKSTRVWYHSDGTPIRLQTVRFKKPGIFTMRRLATIGLYTGIVYGYLRFMWSYMDVEIEFLDEDEELAEQEAAQDEGEEEDEEDEEDGPPFYADDDNTFIPLTWSKKMPRTYYRGSDPEWQEFIRIAKDKPRHRKIQDELVQIVYAGSANHPSINRQLGKDLKVGKFWLDISFPDGPPQEYERSGIEIGDGFIAWSQQRMSQEKQWRLMRALWPQATAQSSWATVKVLSGIQWRRLKQAMGWGDVDPHAPEERFRVASEMMRQQNSEDKEKVSKAQTDPNGSPGEVVSRNSASTPAARPSRRSEDQSQKHPWLPSVPIPSYPFSTPKPTTSSSTGEAQAEDPHADLGNLDIPIAMHVFQSTLSKSWNPKKMEPPRGTFVVQGLVEVRGQRGRILFDVSSAYDPRQGKYVHVNAAVRGFKRWSQPPKGGA